MQHQPKNPHIIPTELKFGIDPAPGLAPKVVEVTRRPRRETTGVTRNTGMCAIGGYLQPLHAPTRSTRTRGECVCGGHERTSEDGTRVYCTTCGRIRVAA